MTITLTAIITGIGSICSLLAAQKWAFPYIEKYINRKHTNAIETLDVNKKLLDVEHDNNKVYENQITFFVNQVENLQKQLLMMTIVPITGSTTTTTSSTTTTTTTTKSLLNNIIQVYTNESIDDTGIYAYSDYDTESQITIEYSLTYDGDTRYQSYTGYILESGTNIDNVQALHVVLNIISYTPYNDSVYNYIVQ